MKKNVLILILGFFVFSSSSFKNSDQVIQENCDIVSQEVYNFAIYHGHSHETASLMSANYFVNCWNNGGFSVLLYYRPF